jgi:hypothetical protein
MHVLPGPPWQFHAYTLASMIPLEEFVKTHLLMLLANKYPTITK